MGFVTVGCRVEKVTGGWLVVFDDDSLMMQDGDTIGMTIRVTPLGELAVTGRVLVEEVLLTELGERGPGTVMEQLRLACDGVLGEFDRVTGEDRLRMIQYVELRLKQLGGEVGLGELREICEEYLEFLAGDEYCEDNDYEGQIYEKAMEVVFGRGIWDRVDELIDRQEGREGAGS